MTRAEQKQIRARGAIATLALLQAKKEVRDQYRRQGVKLVNLTAAQITKDAKQWLQANPDLIMKARALAMELGY